jgi:hypothetical protein
MPPSRGPCNASAGAGADSCKWNKKEKHSSLYLLLPVSIFPRPPSNTLSRMGLVIWCFTPSHLSLASLSVTGAVLLF